MSCDAWDPARYRRFSDERQQPFWDLVALVEADAPSLLVDLGCGSGELTAALHRRWRCARTIGVDSSPAMLAETVLARLAGLLAAGGQLAVQMPANSDHPSHRIAAEVAAEPEFADALQGYVRPSPGRMDQGHAVDGVGGVVAEWHRRSERTPDANAQATASTISERSPGNFSR